MALQLSLNTTALPHHTPILQKMFVALQASYYGHFSSSG